MGLRRGRRAARVPAAARPSANARTVSSRNHVRFGVWRNRPPTSRGSAMNNGTTTRPSAEAAVRAAWSWSRRSRRYQTRPGTVVRHHPTFRTGLLPDASSAGASTRFWTRAWSCSSARLAPASPRSRPATFARTRSSPPMPIDGCSPATKATSGHPASRSAGCTRSWGRRLAAGRLTVVDATNATPHARKVLLGRARDARVPAVAIILDPPAATVHAQNTGRSARAAVRRGRSSPRGVARHHRSGPARGRGLRCDPSPRRIGGRRGQGRATPG